VAVEALQHGIKPLRFCAGMLAVFALMLLVLPDGLWAQEFSGDLALEFRGFFNPPSLAEQPRTTVSLAAEPELYVNWGSQSLLIVPFLRIDQTDSERTHFDFREFIWQKTSNEWELRAGIGKVFWGVTESQHLVDIINQTDFVENIDSEDKLGQPMVNLTWLQQWGTVDFFVLPGFRERTFPGEKGRLRLERRVAAELTEFEALSENRHIDFAVRWSHVIGDWDIGASHFYGTGREPGLRGSVGSDGESVLIPRYVLINQTCLDLQATKGAWLWKLEAISRGGQGDRFSALTGGLEYTFANMRSSGLDLGILFEYLFDSRGGSATTPFEDDLFVAARLALNDVQSTEFLGGVVVDRGSGANFVNIEGSRRLADRWRFNLEMRSFMRVPEDDHFMNGFRNDDHVQLELAWYF